MGRSWLIGVALAMAVAAGCSDDGDAGVRATCASAWATGEGNAQDSGQSESEWIADCVAELEALDETVDVDELRPADEVLAERDAADAVVGVVGEPVSMEDGVLVTVLGIEVNPDWVPGEAWQATHLVDVRAENPTGEDSTAPELQLVCTDNPESGSWMASSTYDMYGELPAGSFIEGQLDLSMPDGPESGVAREDCPALVVELDTANAFELSFGDEGEAPVYRFDAVLPED